MNLGQTAILLELEGLGILIRLEMVNVLNRLPLLLAHGIAIGDSHITRGATVENDSTSVMVTRTLHIESLMVDLSKLAW